MEPATQSENPFASPTDAAEHPFGAPEAPPASGEGWDDDLSFGSPSPARDDMNDAPAAVPQPMAAVETIAEDVSAPGAEGSNAEQGGEKAAAASPSPKLVSPTQEDSVNPFATELGDPFGADDDDVHGGIETDTAAPAVAEPQEEPQPPQDQEAQQEVEEVTAERSGEIEAEQGIPAEHEKRSSDEFTDIAHEAAAEVAAAEIAAAEAEAAAETEETAVVDNANQKEPEAAEVEAQAEGAAEVAQETAVPHPVEEIAAEQAEAEAAVAVAAAAEVTDAEAQEVEEEAAAESNPFAAAAPAEETAETQEEPLVLATAVQETEEELVENLSEAPQPSGGVSEVQAHPPSHAHDVIEDDGDDMIDAEPETERDTQEPSVYAVCASIPDDAPTESAYSVAQIAPAHPPAAHAAAPRTDEASDLGAPAARLGAVPPSMSAASEPSHVEAMYDAASVQYSLATPQPDGSTVWAAGTQDFRERDEQGQEEGQDEAGRSDAAEDDAQDAAQRDDDVASTGAASAASSKPATSLAHEHHTPHTTHDGHPESPPTQPNAWSHDEPDTLPTADTEEPAADQQAGAVDAEFVPEQEEQPREDAVDAAEEEAQAIEPAAVNDSVPQVENTAAFGETEEATDAVGVEDGTAALVPESVPEPEAPVVATEAPEAQVETEAKAVPEPDVQDSSFRVTSPVPEETFNPFAMASNTHGTGVDDPFGTTVEETDESPFGTAAEETKPAQETTTSAAVSPPTSKPPVHPGHLRQPSEALSERSVRRTPVVVQQPIAEETNPWAEAAGGAFGAAPLPPASVPTMTSKDLAAPAAATMATDPFSTAASTSHGGDACPFSGGGSPQVLKSPGVTSTSARELSSPVSMGGHHRQQSTASSTRAVVTNPPVAADSNPWGDAADSNPFGAPPAAEKADENPFGTAATAHATDDSNPFGAPPAEGDDANPFAAAADVPAFGSPVAHHQIAAAPTPPNTPAVVATAAAAPVSPAVPPAAAAPTHATFESSPAPTAGSTAPPTAVMSPAPQTRAPVIPALNTAAAAAAAAAAPTSVPPVSAPQQEAQGHHAAGAAPAQQAEAPCPFGGNGVVMTEVAEEDSNPFASMGGDDPFGNNGSFPSARGGGTPQQHPVVSPPLVAGKPLQSPLTPRLERPAQPPASVSPMKTSPQQHQQQMDAHATGGHPTQHHAPAAQAPPGHGAANGLAAGPSHNAAVITTVHEEESNPFAAAAGSDDPFGQIGGTSDPFGAPPADAAAAGFGGQDHGAGLISAVGMGQKEASPFDDLSDDAIDTAEASFNVGSGSQTSPEVQQQSVQQQMQGHHVPQWPSSGGATPASHLTPPGPGPSSMGTHAPPAALQPHGGHVAPHAAAEHQHQHQHQHAQQQQVPLPPQHPHQQQQPQFQPMPAQTAADHAQFHPTSPAMPVAPPGTPAVGYQSSGSVAPLQPQSHDHSAAAPYPAAAHPHQPPPQPFQPSATGVMQQPHDQQLHQQHPQQQQQPQPWTPGAQVQAHAGAAPPSAPQQQPYVPQGAPNAIEQQHHGVAPAPHAPAGQQQPWQPQQAPQAGATTAAAHPPVAPSHSLQQQSYPGTGHASSGVPTPTAVPHQPVYATGGSNPPPPQQAAGQPFVPPTAAFTPGQVQQAPNVGQQQMVPQQQQVPAGAGGVSPLALSKQPTPQQTPSQGPHDQQLRTSFGGPPLPGGQHPPSLPGGPPTGGDIQWSQTSVPQTTYQYRPCCPVVLGNAGSIVVVSGSMVTCDTLARVLKQTEHPAGQRYLSALSGLPGPMDANIKGEKVTEALNAVSPQPSPLKSLLSSLSQQQRFDWTKDLEMVHDVLKEAIVAAPPAPTALLQQAMTQPPPAMDTATAQGIEQALVAGDRPGALKKALEAKQFAHAVLIAVMCDKTSYQDAINAMIKETLVDASPLAQAYRLFNEMALADPVHHGPPGADGEVHPAVNTKDLDQWAMQVRLVVANWMSGSLQGLVAWGDALAQARRFDEAHVCYLIAQMSPSAAQQQVSDALRNKYSLLGGAHRRDCCRSLLVSPRTVYFTEVLELMRRRTNDKFVRGQLVPFKIIQGLQLLEIGDVSKADEYLAAVAKLLPAATKTKKEDPVPRNLASYIDTWRGHISKMNKPAQKNQSGGWFGGLFGGGKKQPTSKAKTIAAGSSSTPQNASPGAASPQSQASPSPAQGGGLASSASAGGSQRPSPSPAKASPAPEDKDKEGSGWLGWLGGGKKKDKKIVKMILDDEKPEIDPATGKYKFELTDEQKQVQAQVAAGPPKLSALKKPAGPGPTGGGGMPGPVGMPTPGPAPGPGPAPAAFQPPMPQVDPMTGTYQPPSAPMPATAFLPGQPAETFTPGAPQQPPAVPQQTFMPPNAMQPGQPAAPPAPGQPTGSPVPQAMPGMPAMPPPPGPAPTRHVSARYADAFN